MESHIIVLTIFAITIGVTTACFITNCPPGGKRSFPMSESAKKQVFIVKRVFNFENIETNNLKSSALVVVLLVLAVVLVQISVVVKEWDVILRIDIPQFVVLKIIVHIPVKMMESLVPMERESVL
jgi:hypothetical protein